MLLAKTLGLRFLEMHRTVSTCLPLSSQHPISKLQTSEENQPRE